VIESPPKRPLSDPTSFDAIVVPVTNEGVLDGAALDVVRRFPGVAPVLRCPFFQRWPASQFKPPSSVLLVDVSASTTVILLPTRQAVRQRDNPSLLEEGFAAMVPHARSRVWRRLAIPLYWFRDVPFVKDLAVSTFLHEDVVAALHICP